MKSTPVRSVRLDSLLAESLDRPIDFVKLDIQGAEGWALEGMTTLIDNSTSVQIVTEYWPAGLEQIGYGATRYLKYLSALGFRLYDLKQNGSRLVESSAEQLAQWYPAHFNGHTNLLCRR